MVSNRSILLTGSVLCLGGVVLFATTRGGSTSEPINAPLASKPAEAVPAAKPAASATALPAAAHRHGKGCQCVEAHSCNFTQPSGFAKLIDEADLVVTGVAAGDIQVGDAATWAIVDVATTLRESVSDGGPKPAAQAIRRIAVLTSANSINLDHIPEGESLLLMLTAIPRNSKLAPHMPGGIAAYAPSAFLNSVVHLESNECAGALALAQSLAATTPARLTNPTFTARADALSRAITDGGRLVRHRAALDLLRSQPLVDALTPAHVAKLAGVLDTADGTEPVTRELLSVLASRSDASLVADMVRVLEKPAAHRLFDELARVLNAPALRDTAVSALAPYLHPSKTPLQRRLAAFVLARLETPAAEPALTLLLTDAEQDVASEALIGLASRDCAAARTLALETLRGCLAQAPVQDPDTPVARMIRTREFEQTRHALHTGDQFRQLAAGYWAARSPFAEDREWLAGRASRISDYAVRVFVRDRLVNTWATYDTPW